VTKKGRVADKSSKAKTDESRVPSVETYTIVADSAEKCETAASFSDSDANMQLQADKIKRISAGMFRKDIEDVKVGELFFMLGSPLKVNLEYEWVDLRPQITADLVDINVDLSNMLRRLVHLANPEFTEMRRPKVWQNIFCTSN
jgi:hypothetical protein